MENEWEKRGSEKVGNYPIAHVSRGKGKTKFGMSEFKPWSLMPGGGGAVWSVTFDSLWLHAPQPTRNNMLADPWTGKATGVMLTTADWIYNTGIWQSSHQENKKSETKEC